MSWKFCSTTFSHRVSWHGYIRAYYHVSWSTRMVEFLATSGDKIDLKDYCGRLNTTTYILLGDQSLLNLCSETGHYYSWSFRILTHTSLLTHRAWLWFAWRVSCYLRYPLFVSETCSVCETRSIRTSCVRSLLPTPCGSSTLSYR